jgi:hypothetical protein
VISRASRPSSVIAPLLDIPPPLPLRYGWSGQCRVQNATFPLLLIF